MPKGIIDIALMYSFLKRLVKPFDQWDAFKAGVIDAEGNVIIPPDKRTLAQQDSYGYYDRVVANLKKLIGKVPGGKTRLATFASALLLMREENISNDEKVLSIMLNEYMIEASHHFSEEVINTVDANVGSETVDNPSPKKRKKSNILSRIKDLKSVNTSDKLSDFL